MLAKQIQSNKLHRALICNNLYFMYLYLTPASKFKTVRALNQNTIMNNFKRIFLLFVVTH